MVVKYHEQPSPVTMITHPQESFTATSFPKDSFFGRRRDVVRSTTLRYQLDMLRMTGRYDAFKLEWHPIYDEYKKNRHSATTVPPYMFWDSDVGKWIEAACYFLTEEYDEEINNAVKELVEDIRGAQSKAGDDGYINIHYTVVEVGAIVFYFED
jgi:DUF1680 family protein